ncbi:MAG: hypothetical protein H7249_20575 [Chitinophagaceae bacterium]|nr:hypothetical protein [Oligoflexus sp.]
MPSFIRKLSLFALVSFFGIAQAGQTEPKITMQAGQTQVLAIPSGSTLDLNPRKIIEIEAFGKGQVRLLALKSGIVLLKAKNSETEKTWLIEVLGRDQQSDWLLRSEWQSFFCARSGVHCDLENKVISGTTDDLSWFYEARDTCKKKMPCSWQVLLSDAAAAKASVNLGPLLAHFPFKLTPDGQIRLESFCDETDKKSLEKVVANLAETYHIAPQISCALRAPDLWAIDVLVTAERKGQGEISNPLQWEKIEIPERQPLRATLAGLSQTSGMRILAQPALSLSLGGTAILRDGQEIQTLAVQKDTEEILWKTSGFRLELKLIEIKDEKARVQIHMNLSQPQAGLRTIDASEFVSELWLPLSVLQKVGRLEATLDGSETHKVPWLSAIPFLGVLFRWDGDTHAKSQVDIFLRIRPGALNEDSPDTEHSPETG